LYRALTFEAPPKAMDRVRRDPIRVLAEDAQLLKRCSRGFLSSIDRALAFDEGDRPQSVAEWRAELEGGESVRSPVAKKSESKPEPKPVSKKRAVKDVVPLGSWPRSWWRR